MNNELRLIAESLDRMVSAMSNLASPAKVEIAADDAQLTINRYSQAYTESLEREQKLCSELARLREVVLEMRGALKELMGESERMRPFHKLPDGMRTAMVRAHRALDGKKNNGQ